MSSHLMNSRLLISRASMDSAYEPLYWTLIPSGDFCEVANTWLPVGLKNGFELPSYSMIENVGLLKLLTTG